MVKIIDRMPTEEEMWDIYCKGSTVRIWDTDGIMYQGFVDGFNWADEVDDGSPPELELGDPANFVLEQQEIARIEILKQIKK